MYNVLLWTMRANQKLDLFRFIFCWPGPVFFLPFSFFSPLLLLLDFFGVDYVWKWNID